MSTHTTVEMEFSGDGCLCDLNIKVLHEGVYSLEHARYLHRVCAEELSNDCDYEQLANRIKDRVCKEKEVDPDTIYVTINPDKKRNSP